MSEVEQTEFNLNIGCCDLDHLHNEKCHTKFHIHRSSCFVMFKERGAGLSLISRALQPYHHQGFQLEEGFSNSVGNPHEICIIREKLQDMRFELL